MWVWKVEEDEDESGAMVKEKAEKLARINDPLRSVTCFVLTNISWHFQQRRKRRLQSNHRHDQGHLHETFLAKATLPARDS